MVQICPGSCFVVLTCPIRRMMPALTCHSSPGCLSQTRPEKTTILVQLLTSQTKYTAHRTDIVLLTPLTISEQFKTLRSPLSIFVEILQTSKYCPFGQKRKYYHHLSIELTYVALSPDLTAASTDPTFSFAVCNYNCPQTMHTDLKYHRFSYLADAALELANFADLSRYRYHLLWTVLATIIVTGPQPSLSNRIYIRTYQRPPVHKHAHINTPIDILDYKAWPCL